MDQKGLFDEKEGGVPDGDDLLEVKETKKVPKKSNMTLLVGLGVLLIIVVFAAKFFLLNEEEPVVPQTPARIPIKEAPVVAEVPSVNDVVKEEIKDKPVVEAKKEEVKATVEVTKESSAKKGPGVIVGTYAAKYEAEMARAKLKGVPHKVKEAKKKLMMYRLIAKEVKDKDEANVVVSGLRENGYDPFILRNNDLYKVYAVSNANEAISKANKEDLEKLGYLPVIEKGEVKVKVYQVVAGSKSEEDAKALSQRLKKLGFKPEIQK